MAVSDTICRAIRERRLLSFTYKASVRTAEPYIFGYDDSGTLVLSAFQTQGGSGVGFRTFFVEGLSAPQVTASRFFVARPEYNPRDPYFATVICKV